MNVLKPHQINISNIFIDNFDCFNKRPLTKTRSNPYYLAGFLGKNEKESWKNMKKIVTKKIGITLACTTLLGEVVAPVAVPAFKNIVHAEEINQQQPISVAVIAISETDGPLSHHYITINPERQKR